MAIMNVLAELHQEHDLKVNLKAALSFGAFSAFTLLKFTGKVEYLVGGREAL